MGFLDSDSNLTICDDDIETLNVELESASTGCTSLCVHVVKAGRVILSEA